jgi:hypothetical protein
VAPLVPDREEAAAITWGGAAFCEACRLMRRNYEAETGEKVGPCFRNPDRGGPCIAPAPELEPSLAGLFEVHDATPRGAIVTAGMDGIPQGHDLRQVEVVARAVGEPFDSEFVRRWGVLEAFWLFQELQAVKARRK